MEALTRKNPRYVVLKINIGKGQTPVVAQYKIRGIPHLVVVENGKVMASGNSAYAMIAKEL